MSTPPTPYVQSISGCFDAVIGRHGLTRDEFVRTRDRLAPALSSLQDDYRQRRLPLLRISEDTEDLAAAAAALDRLSEGADTVVFFGTGGSSLGGQTLAQFGGWNIPGVASESLMLWSNGAR